MDKTIVITLNSTMPMEMGISCTYSLRIYSDFPRPVPASDFIHICLTLLMSSFSSWRIQTLLFPLYGTYKCTCIYAHPTFFPPITDEVLSRSLTFSDLFPSFIPYLLIFNLLEFFRSVLEHVNVPLSLKHVFLHLPSPPTSFCTFPSQYRCHPQSSSCL